jgi:predicted short-subunit dehydrogenase-like oxidoreductase (DUF2520 family)
MNDPRTERGDELPWIIAGTGRLGSALAWLAETYRLPLIACANRHEPRWELPSSLPVWSWREVREFLATNAAVIWLTIRDDALTEESRRLSDVLRPDSIVLHTSGSRGSHILQHGDAGYGVGSLHPLLSIADPKTSIEKLRHCGWTFEGSKSARQVVEVLRASTGIRPHDVLSDRKSLYHAAAVSASGHLVALLDSAIRMAKASGLEGKAAKEMILNLAGSSLENLERMEAEDALTGPSARGDMETIERHVKVIKESGLERYLPGYLALSRGSDVIAARREDRKMDPET